MSSEEMKQAFIKAGPVMARFTPAGAQAPRAA
jgi:hypothetical protein